MTYKIYDVDVAYATKKFGLDNFSIVQMATGKQLNDVGLTCKQWIMSSTESSYHRWRVWVADDDGSCLTYLKLRFHRAQVVQGLYPIPSWCKNPSRLNPKLTQSDN